MQMESWISQLLIKPQQNQPTLPSPIIRAGFLKNRSRDWSNRLKNSRIKMKKSEEKSKLRIVLKDIVSISSIPWTKLETKCLKIRRDRFWVRLLRFRTGSQTILMLKLSNFKPNRRKLREYTILSSQSTIKVMEINKIAGNKPIMPMQDMLDLKSMKLIDDFKCFLSFYSFLY